LVRDGENSGISENASGEAQTKKKTDRTGRGRKKREEMATQSKGEKVIKRIFKKKRCRAVCGNRNSGELGRKADVGKKIGSRSTGNGGTKQVKESLKRSVLGS